MIAALWAKSSRLILTVLAAIAAVAAIYFRGRSAGKKVEQKKAIERDLNEAKEHAEVIREVSEVQANVVKMPQSEVRNKLAEKWQRD